MRKSRGPAAHFEYPNVTGRQMKVVVWTGARGSGKTTEALTLAQKARAEGFAVAGLAAEAVSRGGRRVGYDVVDLATSARACLARLGLNGPVQAGRYGFLAEGLAMGKDALLSPAALASDLVIVDEFGPLELRGEGWRPAVDALVSDARGLIVLVVRDSLAAAVEDLYRKFGCIKLPATPGSADVILEMLRKSSSRRGGRTS